MEYLKTISETIKGRETNNTKDNKWVNVVRETCKSYEQTCAIEQTCAVALSCLKDLQLSLKIFPILKVH